MRALLCACALLAAAACAAAQGLPGGANFKKPDLPPAVREDVKLIKCSMCNHFVKQALRGVKALREGLKPGKKLQESDIIDRLEKMCDPTIPEGEWIRQIDIVEEGDVLELKDMGQMGRHNSETSTVARACSSLAEDLDLVDLSEALYLGKKTRAQLTQMACYEMTSVCKTKATVPKDREPGPAFQALSPEDVKREQMMAKLAEMGMGGQMFDRESLKEKMGEAEDDDDEEGAEGGAGGGGSGGKGGGEGGKGGKKKVREVTTEDGTPMTARAVGGSGDEEVPAEYIKKAGDIISGIKNMFSGAGKKKAGAGGDAGLAAGGGDGDDDDEGDVVEGADEL